MKTNPSDAPAKRVLCGTDFTPISKQAADVACLFAKHLDVPAELLHVSAIEAGMPLVDEMGNEAKRLRQLGFHVRETSLEGIPAEKLANRAKPGSYQMIVVASHGKSIVERMLRGSVSEQTSERATVPTLVVTDSEPLVSWMRGERVLKVFVAFNHTPTSRSALSWVKTLSDIGPCDVVVGYVDSPHEQKARLGSKDWPPMKGNPPEMQAVLERELHDKVADILGAGDFKIRVLGDLGNPDAVLGTMAREEGPDLIVVGTHRHQGFARLWTTTVSCGLLRNAATNVAVVPLTTDVSKGVRVAPPIGKVVATTDFSKLANHAIPHAYSLLRGGGIVHLVHVIHPEELPNGEFLHGPATSAFTKRHGKHKNACADKLRALIPKDAESLGIHSELEVVEHFDAATGICQAAERFGADAICSGTHGRTGLPEALLGSTAQKVLSRSKRPLLLVRAPEDA